eukprot:CAMPEP_0179853178 /NCGR_PEP_ID=MMETSP0982-20121206/9212_1 /TAXON_ID=483367 /ORGANISM="non described non described, Strain CCMP 2436" /LENGTH=275 /DNA_ID=CAMNT_0021738881 /DNA_START=31 /DNA_END=856 /DNA_ORIENTATION=-
MKGVLGWRCYKFAGAESVAASSLRTIRSISGSSSPDPPSAAPCAPTEPPARTAASNCTSGLRGVVAAESLTHAPFSSRRVERADAGDALADCAQRREWPARVALLHDLGGRVGAHPAEFQGDELLRRGRVHVDGAAFRAAPLSARTKEHAAFLNLAARDVHAALRDLGGPWGPWGPCGPRGPGDIEALRDLAACNVHAALRAAHAACNVHATLRAAHAACNVHAALRAAHAACNVHAALRAVHAACNVAALRARDSLEWHVRIHPSHPARPRPSE